MNCEQVLYIRKRKKVIKKSEKKCLQYNARMVLCECKKKEAYRKRRELKKVLVRTPITKTSTTQKQAIYIHIKNERKKPL